ATVVIVAIILWLVERNNQGPAWPVHGAQGVAGWPYQPGPPAHGAPPPPVWPAVPPGWHPDPSGANRWRWWDGQRWTEHVSQHSQ
ncbi:MAG TPA: DUF2510 domain-containing protein, partial [Acidimicrobiales bacterium]|nr:DUF2510 domain-containing protein [Acidimicrobiales bacterium]